MYQQSFSVGGAHDIILQIEQGGGDIHVMGSDETYVRVQGEGDAEDYNTTYQNGTLTLSLHGDCVFFIPRKMNLKVHGRFGELRATDLAGALDIEDGQGDVLISGATGSVRLAEVTGDLRAGVLGSLTVSGPIHGDAIITSVAGAVRLAAVSADLQASEIGSLELSGDIAGSAKIGDVRESAVLHDVSGDLIIRGAQSFTARSIHGDLRVSDVAGDLAVGEVSGDARIKSIGGNCALTRAAGDAQLSSIGGLLSGFSAGGDLQVQGPLAGEGAFEFSAGGDLVLKLPADTSAQFECMAGGDVVNRISGEKSHSFHGVWKGSIGTGGPLVKCHAGGDIRLKREEGGDVEIRFEINKEEMRHAQEEVRRAKEELKRIKHDVRDQLRMHKDDIHRTVHENVSRGFRFGPDAWGAPRGPRAPRPPREPRGPRPPRGPAGESDFPFSFGPYVREFFFRKGGESRPAAASRGASDEERMTILKMLEEKRITPDQAELLLNALGEE
jgi:DUF4097 and DUF4098 domain-containing protein YvlB